MQKAAVAMNSYYALLMVSEIEPDATELPAEPTRAIAMMALLGIALLGLLMIAATMLGASWVRKLGQHKRGPAVPPDVVMPTERSESTHEPKNGSLTGDTISGDETIIQ